MRSKNANSVLQPPTPMQCLSVKKPYDVANADPGRLELLGVDRKSMKARVVEAEKDDPVFKPEAGQELGEVGRQDELFSVDFGRLEVCQPIRILGLPLLKGVQPLEAEDVSEVDEGGLEKSRKMVCVNILGD